MAVPLKTSQFAEIYVVGLKMINSTLENSDLLDNNPTKVPLPDGGTYSYEVYKVGLATNLRINENLGSRTRTVIGTPIPLMVPGFYDGSITMEKVTLDLHSFKSTVGMNPLIAFNPNIYKTNDDVSSIAYVDLNGLDSVLPKINNVLGNPGNLELYTVSGKSFLVDDAYLPPFVFLIALKDKILRGEVSINTGVFVAMLRDFSITLTSENAIIAENVTAIARPIGNSGWFQVLGDYFRTSPAFGYTYSPPQK
jgi:hypothetical protein